MINFENAQTKSASTIANSNNNVIILLFTFILVISLYIAIKFSVNFQKSLDYTKKATGDKLKKPFIYGLKFSTPSLINLFIFEILLIVVMIWTAINFYNEVTSFYYKNIQEARANGQEVQSFNYASSKSIFNYFTMLLPFLYAPLIFLYNFVTYKKAFNDPKYKNKNFVYELKKTLQEEFDDIKVVKEIRVDIEKMKSKNPLGAKVLAKKVYQLNNLEKLDFQKAYKFALEMEFIKNYYEFYVKNFTFFGAYFNQKKIRNFKIDYENDYSSTIEKQIQWMNDAEKSIKNNNQLNETSSQLYHYKNINMTLMRNQRKNSSLTTNTNDINYLGVDPSIQLSYSLDNEIQPEFDIADILKVIADNAWKKLILKM
ncbi:hypothetical protein KQ875_02945 [Mycoplasma zalophi]|uniref:Uncharacterized protein n=1 Tax=Mycoplasma zalophi TaxID=191287 RepID=A0ABS6DQK7_9MOLU|nr:hypothetical protein [Mycoplasma zalophi]MBU4692533.1 hypothetical protein [Mycoplasma zalophi]